MFVAKAKISWWYISITLNHTIIYLERDDNINKIFSNKTLLSSGLDE